MGPQCPIIVCVARADVNLHVISHADILVTFSSCGLWIARLSLNSAYFYMDTRTDHHQVQRWLAGSSDVA